jgi:hypothetical protein
MRLLLPAPGFPPLFYEINISEEPASFTISGFDHAARCQRAENSRFRAAQLRVHR